MSDWGQRNELWVGRVELLFRARFIGPNAPLEFDLAFVSCLHDVKIPELQGPLQKKGAHMFYESTEPWTFVVPVHHIIGRAPLLKAYIGGGTTNTLPHHLGHHKREYFEYGRVDRPGPSQPGTGRAVFELNTLLWRWGRPGWDKPLADSDRVRDSDSESDTD